MSNLILRIGGGVLAGVSVALAFYSRAHPVGLYAWDFGLGDFLWALMIYLVLVMVRPGSRPWHVWAVASGICIANELFKLTGLPMAWREYAISRLLFGTTPGWNNIVFYLPGTTLGFALHTLYIRVATRAEVRAG